MMQHDHCRKGLVDRDYVDRRTLGYEGCCAEACREYDPLRVAEITGLSAGGDHPAGARIRDDDAGGDQAQATGCSATPAVGLQCGQSVACRR
jgi:hypothetical protein